MPVPLAPILIPAAATALGSIFGSKSQRKSQKEALKQEKRYTDLALQDAREVRAYDRTRADEDRAYERGRYADERDFERGRYTEERDFGRKQHAGYLDRLSPYSRAGAGAVTGLAASTARAMPGVVPTSGGGRMVQIQAPNGQIREVPESHAQHYVSKGGVVVGGG